MANYTDGPTPRPIVFVTKEEYSADIRLYLDLIRRPSVLYIQDETGATTSTIDCGMDLPDPTLAEWGPTPTFEEALISYYAAADAFGKAQNAFDVAGQVLEAARLRDLGLVP